MSLKLQSKKSYLSILKLSSIFTVILIVCQIFATAISFNSSRKNEISRLIGQKLNSVETLTETENFQRLVKELRTLAKVENIGLFSTECNLLAATSWIMDQRSCHLLDEYLVIRTIFNNRPIIILVEYKINHLEVILQNKSELTLIFVFFFFASSLGIYLFTYFSFLRPINQIEKYITESKDIGSSPRGFELIVTRLMDFKNLISKSENEKAYTELAKTVVHDIRTPLHFINLQINDNRPKEEILNRLNEIEIKIRNYLKPPVSKVTIYPISIFLEQLKSDVASFYKSINLEIECEFNFYESLIPLNEVQNILQNLIKNSKEAKASTINISISHKDNNISITVLDNGQGISKEASENIFKRSYTTKTDGHGIGLSGIKHFLNKHGGDLSLDSNYNGGAKFLITFPGLGKHFPDKFVLIDDDRFIHQDWLRRSSKMSLNLDCFYSIDEFLKDHLKYSPTTTIFIDSSLSENSSGEIDSEKIFNKGFRNLYLTTSYTDIDPTLYPWLKSVLGKASPFIL